MFYFVAAGDNTTSVTLNIDSLGAKAVTRDGSTALVAADIKSGEVIVVVYDGTRFQVVSQLNSAGNATFANVSITSALNVGGVATFSAGTAAAPSITTTGDTNTGIFFPAADTIAFTEGGTESFRVNSSGNMGLGTTSPTNTAGFSRQLQIEGTTAALTLSGTTGTGKYTLGVPGANACGLWDNTASAYRWYVDSSGNVGIGTASPAAKLEVSGSLTTTADVSGLLTLGRFSAGTPWSLIRPSSGSSGFEFRSFAGTAWLNIDTSGNVGIGTASPASKLTVSGDVHILSTNYLNFTNTAQQTYIRAPASNTIAFGTSSTEQMRLDSSGNLGLGVTPRAWAGGYKSLDIVGPGAIASTASGDTFTQVANGAWFNGTNWIYQYTGIGAARYQMTGPSGGGNHSWYVAGSGTAGNAISFTQALTLNSNGNLALQGGTTTASGVGITFPASQSASTDANCLDDYEEGAFTPSFIGTTTNPTVTYGEQAGIYTKVGNLVTFRIRLTATGATGGSGDLRVAGLPFAARGVNNAGIVVVQFALGWGTFPLGPNSIAGSSEIILQTTNISNANITVANLTGGSFDKFYVIAGSYFV
jgi:hypothetical protein